MARDNQCVGIKSRYGPQTLRLYFKYKIPGGKKEWTLKRNGGGGGGINICNVYLENGSIHTY